YGDEHLSTILETKSDEFIKASVENLVQNLSESKDECECDVPDCDDSQMTNFSTFSNPLFDDSTSSDDESSHEEVIHEMNFKTYSNPLFDLVEEIISSEFNPIHNEDFDSTPKNDRFDTSDSLMEEIAIFLALDDSMPPGIENDDYDSEGDILFLEEFLSNDSPSLPENESFYFDIPSSHRPLEKPPNDDEIKLDTGVLTTKVMGDISEHYVLMPRL
nr:hypothetical protein [Tanacetum cinerariifolium]